MSLSEITPIRRLENFLQDIADGAETPTKAPITRIEEFLRRIAFKIHNSGVTAGYRTTRAATTGTNLPSLSATTAAIADGVVAFRKLWESASTVSEFYAALSHIKVLVNGCEVSWASLTSVPASQCTGTVSLPIPQYDSGGALTTIIYATITVSLSKSGSNILSFTTKYYDGKTGTELASHASHDFNWSYTIIINI